MERFTNIRVYTQVKVMLSKPNIAIVEVGVDKGCIYIVDSEDHTYNLGDISSEITVQSATATEECDCGTPNTNVLATVLKGVDGITPDMSNYYPKMDVDVKLSKKQDSIADIDAIRVNASKGATALQSIPEDYVTEAELANKRYATVAQLSDKQDEITDLPTIRRNITTALNSTNKNTTAIAEVRTDVDAINASIEDMKEDINDINHQVGDVYNIWFEEAGYVGSIPTLDNYPAIEWSEDLWAYHDRDLYYSQSLGQAWRFNYNDGNPYWESITDADTIAALTKAREALEKAQEACDGVNSIEYLKTIFGEGKVLNEYSAILSRLLAVKDENDKVRAGLYGGGVKTLEDNGYKDSAHGKLMLFAGANDAQSVSSADFRVYEDGSLYANSGTFGGILKRSKKVLLPLNIGKYILPSNDSTTSVINLAATGSHIVLRNFAGSWSPTNKDNVKLVLPWYSGNDAACPSTLSEMLSLVGAKIIIESEMTFGNSMCFDAPEATEDGIMPQCRKIESGNIIIAECVAGKTSEGVIYVGWKTTTL